MWQNYFMQKRGVRSPIMFTIHCVLSVLSVFCVYASSLFPASQRSLCSLRSLCSRVPCASARDLL